VVSQDAPPDAKLTPYNEPIRRTYRSQKRLIFKDTFAETESDIPDRDNRTLGRDLVAGGGGCRNAPGQGVRPERFVDQFPGRPRGTGSGE
jgi:hypothetical protein